MRTHKNNELKKEQIGDKVTLVGWVSTRRDHGGIIFIDLRDRYGITQIVFDPEFNSNFMKIADTLRREDCIKISGEVKPRKEGMENLKLPTGAIEVFIDDLKIINKSEVPPIDVDDRMEAGEDLRLKYRYLDLRRPSMQAKLAFRHKVVSTARNFLNSKDFLEIETPLLVKSTPEGARDYVVPSRVNAGKFYALPQSPQLYKQLLMVAGCDRYYQIARCLRDEDLRADRQPEHTQIDLEMSFMTSDEIRSMIEGLIQNLFKESMNIEIQTPFVKLSYKDSMTKYGTDKPDIRFELELTQVTDIVAKSDFGVFKDVKDNGGIIKCINPKKELGRKEIDKYIDFCQKNGAKGMAWMRVTENGLESNIAKFFPEDVQKELIEKINAKPGSILMFIADKEKKCNDILAKLRVKLAEDMGLLDDKNFVFSWIYDFPLFVYSEEEKRWVPEHHMFSMPKEEFVGDFEKRPAEVLGDLWDLALNGTEIGSGSIRISNPEIQRRVMNLVGFPEEKANERFGFLLEAYKYGGPNHGGMGLGLDRLVAIMKGTTDIREVIAFPKNKNAECPMDGSPGVIEEKQLKELHLELDAAAKKNIEKASKEQ